MIGDICEGGGMELPLTSKIKPSNEGSSSLREAQNGGLGKPREGVEIQFGPQLTIKYEALP